MSTLCCFLTGILFLLRMGCQLMNLLIFNVIPAPFKMAYKLYKCSKTKERDNRSERSSQYTVKNKRYRDGRSSVSSLSNDSRTSSCFSLDNIVKPKMHFVSRESR